MTTIKREVGDAIWKLLDGLEGINVEGTMLKAEASKISNYQVQIKVWPDANNRPPRYFRITVTEAM